MAKTTRPEPATLEEAIAALPPPAMASLRRTATNVATQYRDLLAPGELENEVMLWLGARPARANRWWFLNEEGEERFGLAIFRRDVAKVMLDAVRRERNAMFGYFSADQIFYTAAVVRTVLPWVFEQPDITGEAGEPDEVRAATDPAVTGDHLATVCDVRKAYRALSSNYQTALELTHRFGLSDESAGESMGMAATSVRRRVNDAIQAMVDWLNRPAGAHEGIGSRRVMSNAAAQWITRNQSGEV